MDPFIKKAGLSRNFLILTSTLALGALVISGIAVLYSNYNRSGGFPSEEVETGQVAVSFPYSGAQVEIGEMVIVEASVIGLMEFTSIELWLDGALVGLQAPPDSKTQPYTVEFAWRPLELGPHSLIVAGVDEVGQKIMSSQVFVTAIQGESVIEILTPDQTGIPAVQPAPPGGSYDPPAEPAMGASTGPAGGWQGTLRNWATSLLANRVPIAPELAVRPMGCGANLLIHDLSDNEEGFVIYRQMANSPTWSELTSLSSQSKFEWIEFSDEGVVGPATYYVSAFNSQGEVASNLAAVAIDPADCPSELVGAFAESITMSLKLDDAGAEKVYCYQSRDGVNWERWPTVGFLSPDEEGNLPVGPVAVQKKEGYGGEWETVPLGLFLECWGWQGGGLSKLGELTIGELEPGLTTKQLVTGAGLKAEFEYHLTEIKNLVNLFPQQLISEDETQPILPSYMPASPDIPRVILSVTSDREVCGMHLPPSIQGTDEEPVLCFQYPAYDPDLENQLPQPYLVWYFDSEPVCIGGPSQECKSYQELVSLAEENGGRVGFTIQSLRGGKKTVWNVTEADLTMFVVPPFSCLGDTAFNVRLWYRPGNKGVSASTSSGDQITAISEDSYSIPETYYGPYSNLVNVPCTTSSLPNPTIAKMVQYYDFTFNILGLSSLDDDDHLATEVVELYGYFFVSGASMGYLVELPCYFSGFENCDNNQTPNLYHAGRTRMLLVDEWESEGVDFIDGITALEYQRLCLSTLRGSCSFEGEPDYYKFHNNTIRVFKQADETFSYGFRLIDYDEASRDDEVCVAFVFHNHGVGSFTLDPDETDSGNCWVRYSIEKVGDPVPLVIPDFYPD